jgi:hypothetical protein
MIDMMTAGATRRGREFARGRGGIGWNTPSYGFSAHHCFASLKTKAKRAIAKLPDKENICCLLPRQDDMKCR